ncbi:hypothetical protein C8J57DRAFT_1292630 [Mycena rebaudengoi]|nr:hypothetical protein C8J57DRAFT_1292630 [Mycena rebaudengoi]
MKSIRKSLNGNKDGGGIRAQISAPAPLPSVSKPPSAILPPQKVIRALSTYRPQAPQELPFKKGDFFYVLPRCRCPGKLVRGPQSGLRCSGSLFPRICLRSLTKTPLLSEQPTPQVRASCVRHNNSSSSNLPRLNLPPNHKSSTQSFYTTSLRNARTSSMPNEGTQSPSLPNRIGNGSWQNPSAVLAVPALFLCLSSRYTDPSTGKAIPDVNALMDRGDLPKVEDWKRAMFNYKQNSIALGVIDSPAGRDSMPNSPFTPQYSPPEPAINIQGPSPHEQAYPNNVSIPPPLDGPDILPDGILLSADVVSFHYEMDEYWFRIDAVFQPYASPNAPLPPSKTLILFRVYNDFYDFQVSLLNTFPREAGREPPHPRMLPYMPGPAQDVDDALTATRRNELDEYVHSLCDLNSSGAKYILEHQVVREFLALKPGDVENEAPARTQEIDMLFGQSLSGQLNAYDDRADAYENDVQDSFGRLRMDDEGSDYEDEGYAPSPQRQTSDRHPYSQVQNERRPSADTNLRLHAHTQNHQRTDSTSSLGLASSPYSHIESPFGRASSPSGNQYHDSSFPPASSPSSSSLRSNSISTRSRSDSTAATSNINSPSISAANPQTAFVKIKIFDRVADDLIAIRVHPRVSHAELMDKVQARLGGEVANLKYRDSMSNAFVGLDSDQQLRAWIEGTDKHVLYAD